MLVSVAFTITAASQAAPYKADAKAISTTVCALVKHPAKFDNKRVTVHARYFTNWEWGAWLGDTGCVGKGLGFLFPTSYQTPSEYAALEFVKDERFLDFKEKASDLCNGMSLLCEFDYLEADFTGIFVMGKRLPSTESSLVVMSVGNAKLHKDENPLIKRSEIPNALPTEQ
jgi:hypothetical protein